MPMWIDWRQEFSEFTGESQDGTLTPTQDPAKIAPDQLMCRPRSHTFGAGTRHLPI